MQRKTAIPLLLTADPLPGVSKPYSRSETVPPEEAQATPLAGEEATNFTAFPIPIQYTEPAVILVRFLHGKPTI